MMCYILFYMMKGVKYDLLHSVVNGGRSGI